MRRKGRCGQTATSPESALLERERQPERAADWVRRWMNQKGTQEEEVWVGGLLASEVFSPGGFLVSLGRRGDERDVNQRT